MFERFFQIVNLVQTIATLVGYVEVTIRGRNRGVEKEEQVLTGLRQQYGVTPEMEPAVKSIINGIVEVANDTGSFRDPRMTIPAETK